MGTRLGIDRGSPLAALASVMKMSPRSSPGSAHKERLTPPAVHREKPPEPKTPSESQSPTKNMEPEPVPEKKQDASKEVEPADIEKSKKDDDNIPEWKKKLEERRVAHMKEQKNIQPSAEDNVCVCVCVCVCLCVHVWCVHVCGYSTIVYTYILLI